MARSHVDLEDAVEYWLFPYLSEDAEELEQLDALRTKYFNYLQSQCHNYIWHEDSINLRVIPQQTFAGKLIHPTGNVKIYVLMFSFCLLPGVIGRFEALNFFWFKKKWE